MKKPKITKIMTIYEFKKLMKEGKVRAKIDLKKDEDLAWVAGDLIFIDERKIEILK